uniref:Dynein heavy chain linker domain-containing protein n=1 Tax=Panagrolaimus sp. ES5 TaxID=591445 RepID=A0AC34FRS1_9BILA
MASKKRPSPHPSSPPNKNKKKKLNNVNQNETAELISADQAAANSALLRSFRASNGANNYNLWLHCNTDIFEKVIDGDPNLKRINKRSNSKGKGTRAARGMIWKKIPTEEKTKWAKLAELQLSQAPTLQQNDENNRNEFLNQVREYWQECEIELVNYQNKTRIIRGWDGLMKKIKEDLNSLAEMKLSQHYNQFEDDAIVLEDRLNKINALFDIWIDVQRRWVNIEGLFSGSADIATLLPTES